MRRNCLYVLSLSSTMNVPLCAAWTTLWRVYSLIVFWFLTTKSEVALMTDLFVVGCWVTAGGCWVVAGGCWVTVSGCWVAVGGCWVFVGGCVGVVAFDFRWSFSASRMSLGFGDGVACGEGWGAALFFLLRS